MDFELCSRQRGKFYHSDVSWCFCMLLYLSNLHIYICRDKDGVYRIMYYAYGPAVLCPSLLLPPGRVSTSITCASITLWRLLEEATLTITPTWLINAKLSLPLRKKTFIYVLFNKNAGTASQKTIRSCITKTSRLVVLDEPSAVFFRHSHQSHKYMKRVLCCNIRC